MMSVLEYAEDVNKTVNEILKKCKELNIDVTDEDSMLDEDAITELDNVITQEEDNEEDFYEDELIEEQEKEIEETKESINEITKHFSKEDSYVTYKVYIVRDGDTFESISNKYNVKLDDIKEYNNTENISIGDKIVIPYIKNE